MTSKAIFEILTNDPAHDLPVSAALHFEPALFAPQMDIGHVALANWDYFDGILLALHFGSSTKQDVTGSAVLVAPGIALAAKHVIDPMIERIMTGESGFICSAISAAGLLLWRATRITLSEGTDVAIISLDYAAKLPANNSFKQAVVTTRTPRVGEPIMIAGFRMEQFANAGDETFAIEGNVYLSTGSVTQHFPDGRDRHLLPWPSIEVDCVTLGGMSGGPAFDKNGLLIGLLTSGVTTEDRSGPSFVSMLWPILGERFHPTWPRGLHKEPTSLIEMAGRLCAIDRPDAVAVDQESEPGRTKATYRIWE